MIVAMTFSYMKREKPFQKGFEGLEICYELFDREFSVKTSPLFQGVVTFFLLKFDFVNF